MASWRIRFHDKWPHLASLYASTHNLDEEGKYPDPMMGQDNVFDPSEPIGAYRYYVQPSMTRSEFSIEEPGYNIRPAYKDEESRSSDYTSGESLHRGSTCRVLLCVFLVFSFIGVVVAAVTLAVLLSKTTLPPKSTIGPVEEYASETKIYAREFNENLLDNSSREFKALEEDLCNALLRMFTEHDSPVRHNYVGCEVIDFRNGSIIARFILKIQSDSPEGFKREARIRQKIQEHFAKKIKESGTWQRVKFDPTYVRRFVKISPEITTESPKTTPDTTTAFSTDTPSTTSIQLNATTDAVTEKTTQIDDIIVSTTEAQTETKTATITTGVSDTISTLSPHSDEKTSLSMDTSTVVVEKPAQTTILEDQTSSTSVPRTSSKPISAASQTDIFTTASTDTPTTPSTDVPSTSSADVHTTSTTDAPSTSSVDVPTTSTTDVPTSSSTYVPATSTTDVPSTSSADVPTTSSADVPITSSVDVPITSSVDALTTSSIAVPFTTTKAAPSITSTIASTASTTGVPSTSFSSDVFEILSTLPLETLEVSTKQKLTTQDLSTDTSQTEMTKQFVTEKQTTTPSPIRNETEHSFSTEIPGKDVESTTFPLDIGTLFDELSTETSQTAGHTTTAEIASTTQEVTTVMPLSITKEKHTTASSPETSQTETFTESISITEQTDPITSEIMTGVSPKRTTSVPEYSTVVLTTAQVSVTPMKMTGTDSVSTIEVTKGVSKEYLTSESTVFFPETTEGTITQTAMPIKQSTTTDKMEIMTETQSLINVTEKYTVPSLPEFNITDGTKPATYTTAKEYLTTSFEPTKPDVKVTTDLFNDTSVTEQPTAVSSVTDSGFTDSMSTQSSLNITEYSHSTNVSTSDTKMNVTDAYSETTETYTVDNATFDSSYLDNTSTPEWMDFTDTSTSLVITSDTTEVPTSSLPPVSTAIASDVPTSTGPSSSVVEQNITTPSSLTEIRTVVKTTSDAPYDNITLNATGKLTTESSFTLISTSNMTADTKNESAEQISTSSTLSETSPIPVDLTTSEVTFTADVNATNVTKPDYVGLSTESTQSTLIDITTSSVSFTSTQTNDNVSRETTFGSTVYSNISSTSPEVTTGPYTTAAQTTSSSSTDFPSTSDYIPDKTTLNTTKEHASMPTMTSDYTVETSTDTPSITEFEETTFQTGTLNLTTQSVSINKTSVHDITTLSNVTEAAKVTTTESVFDESTLSQDNVTLSNDTYMTTMQPDDFNFTNFENVTIQYPEFNATDMSSQYTESTGTTLQPANATSIDFGTTQHSEELIYTKSFQENVTDAAIQNNVTAAPKAEINITSELLNVTQSTVDHTITTESPVIITSSVEVTSNVSVPSFVTPQPFENINTTSVSDLIDGNLTDIINTTGETDNVTFIPYTNETSTTAGNYSDISESTTQSVDNSTEFPDLNITDIDLSTFAPDFTPAPTVNFTTTTLDVLNMSVPVNETKEVNLIEIGSNDTQPLSSMTTVSSAELISEQNKTFSSFHETNTSMRVNKTLDEAGNETNVTALPTTEIPPFLWLNTTGDLLDWENATGFPNDTLTTNAPDVIIDTIDDKTQGVKANVTSTLLTNGTIAKGTSPEAP